MEAFLVSTGVVAVAEIGDKTQLLALMLAARFRAPLPIIAGIFVATVANHLLAAWAGAAVASWLGAAAMRWILGVSFLVMAGWALIPDKADDEPTVAARAGAFAATAVSFFLIEIGDKTQLATVALAARFNDIALVAAGTTLGMMIADVPAVFIGGFASEKLPLKLIRLVAAALFAALGIAALLNLDTMILG
ncbi:MAG: TMEM165/GDT1 family protein [Candidatus Eiseniibacteriota bacterium]